MRKLLPAFQRFISLYRSPAARRRNDWRYDKERIVAVSKYLDLSQSYDRQKSIQCLVDLFFWLQDETPPALFLEIGAFDAGFSRRARKHFPSARVVAFEANPYNFEHWNGGIDFASEGIEYLPIAVSDRLGTAEFLVQASRRGETAPRIKGDDSLYAREEAGIEYETVCVDCTSIDDFISRSGDAPKRTSCWIDVEGAIEPVLEGCRRSLPRISSIFMEVEEKSYWKQQWLLDDIARFLYPRGFRAIARDFENDEQFNIIFLRRELLATVAVQSALQRYADRLGEGC